MPRWRIRCPPLPVIPDKAFSVMDNGAVADGVTDNAAAFQKTIAAAVAAGGGIVQIPAAAKPYLQRGRSRWPARLIWTTWGRMPILLPYSSYPNGGGAYVDFISVRNLNNIADHGRWRS